MKKKSLFMIGIMLVLSLCSIIYIKILEGNNGDAKEKITIVTSFYPIYIAASNVVADVEGIELINLAENQTGCLHDYQLTTQDMKTLEEADVFIINGGGIESFMEGITENYPDLLVIDTSEGIDFLPSEGTSHDHDHEHEGAHEDEHGHEHGDVNPHIWLDPSRYIMQVGNIRDGLISFNKENGTIYNNNAAQYIGEVEKVREELFESLKDPLNKEIVIFHDGFAYLSDILGLDLVYTVNLEEDTTLSAGEIGEIIDEIRYHGVKALYTEEQYSLQIPANVGKETGVEVYVINTIVDGDGTRDSYINGMRSNIQVLKNSLYEE